MACDWLRKNQILLRKSNKSSSLKTCFSEFLWLLSSWNSYLLGTRHSLTVTRCKTSYNMALGMMLRKSAETPQNRIKINRKFDNCSLLLLFGAVWIFLLYQTVNNTFCLHTMRHLCEIILKKDQICRRTGWWLLHHDHR